MEWKDGRESQFLCVKYSDQAGLAPFLCRLFSCFAVLICPVVLIFLTKIVDQGYPTFCFPREPIIFSCINWIAFEGNLFFSGRT